MTVTSRIVIYLNILKLCFGAGEHFVYNVGDTAPSIDNNLDRKILISGIMANEGDENHQQPSVSNNQQSPPIPNDDPDPIAIIELTLNQDSNDYRQPAFEGEERKETPSEHSGSSHPNISAFFTRLDSMGYDPRIRPNVFIKPVIVTCALFMSAISGISESNMDYSVDIYLRQTWIDPRLQWDMEHGKDNYEDSVLIPPEFFNQVWRPDTFFVNEKAGGFHYVSQLNSFIRIMPDGHVTFSIRISLRAFCYMDFTYFPVSTPLPFFQFN